MKSIERINRAFSRAAKSYNTAASVQSAISLKLAHMLPEGLSLREVYEIGAGTGLLTQAIDRHCSIAHWTLNDLSASMLAQLPSLHDTAPTLIVGDAQEVSPWERTQQFDLIASASSLQWFESPKSFVKRLIPLLKKEGFLLLSTFGTRNLYELSTLTGNGLHYHSAIEWQQLLTPYFGEVEVREEEITLAFPNIMALLRHLKATGVTHLPQRSNNKLISSSHAIRELESRYRNQFALPDGTLALTYHPIFIMTYKRKD